MTDTQVSPISQLLYTLGITREDLNKRSDQMRQFLTTDDILSSRVLERETSYRPRSSSDLRSSSRSVASSRSLGRSLSRTSSSSVRDGTPPATPVKAEPHEGEIPHRRMDSMEMVIERQRRQRRSRKDRGRDSCKSVAPPPSPSPAPSSASHSGRSLDSFMQSRDDTHPSGPSSSEGTQNSVSETSSEPPPVTPQKSRYYRDHTNLSSDAQAHKDISCKPETPTPTRPVAQSLPQPQYYAYPAYIGYPHFMPMAYRPAPATSALPVTPQPQRILPPPPPRTATSSPLPPSSPPPASSPLSSPTRPFNLVSSPGPMGPPPEETEYDSLPYTLPPGPYSPSKPDLSYAALVGRAILSSPEHRLTLQEIYDWITIVYPHYKRGETTWMNSIRHVLSTTICFRKVPRDRSVGRTLWAIYDEDLECFKDGGFKKHLCKDYNNGAETKDKQPSVSKGKPRVRKRADDDDATERKPKKLRKDQTFPSTSTLESNVAFMASISLPLFPPTRPTTHHQPYYQSCLPHHQGFPPEVIFPPLPASASFNTRVINNTTSSSTPITKENDTPAQNTEHCASEDHSSPIPSFPSSTSSSHSSIPELTPNRTSSSPPSSLPATSDADIDMYSSRPASSNGDICRMNVSNSPSTTQDEPKIGTSVPSDGDDDDSIFNDMLLGPVKFWGESPKASSLLQPGIELMDFNLASDDENGSSSREKKGKKKQGIRNSKNFPPVPTSPTLNRAKHAPPKSDDSACLAATVPSTPPRSTRQQHQISSIRTPLSHKGLHMSPSASLAHYKLNLDPPPVYNAGVQPLDVQGADDDDPMRTPRKRGTNTSSSVFGHPVTPRKLVFPAPLGDSPFRTPMGGLSASPFRTPGSRSIYDPHDPRTLLDEELDRINYGYNSPAGLFGKAHGSLLYDSPGVDSPPKWW